MKNTRENVHNFQSMIIKTRPIFFLKKSRRKGDWSRFFEKFTPKGPRLSEGGPNFENLHVKIYNLENEVHNFEKSTHKRSTIL